MKPINNQGKAALIITIIISIFLIIGTAVGVWYWKTQKANQEKATLEQQKADLEKKIDKLGEQEKVVGDKLDIKEVDFSTKIKEGLKIGNFLDNIYGDLTGDGQDDALIRFLNEDTGKYLDVYVYSYQNRELKEIFKKEGLYKGSASIENGILSLSYVDLSSKENIGKSNSDLVPSSLNYKWDGTKFSVFQ